VALGRRKPGRHPCGSCKNCNYCFGLGEKGGCFLALGDFFFAVSCRFVWWWWAGLGAVVLSGPLLEEIEE
jgi:hypothetical protein